MTEKQTFILRDERIVGNALAAVRQAGQNCRVTIYPPARTSDQNAKLWAMLSDVAKAKPEGRNWVPETWKAAFMHSLGHQVLFAEGLDGSGPFPVGFRTSKLSVRQMIDLIDVITEYGTRHGVQWTETENQGWRDAA